MNLGRHPQPTAPWRPLIFRVHCVVTERWMKIRVPFAWFWFGETDYGTPEVESGTIASTQPKPPAEVMAEAMRRRAIQESQQPAEPLLPSPVRMPPEPPLKPYRTPTRGHNAIADEAARLQERVAARLRGIAPQ